MVTAADYLLAFGDRLIDFMRRANVPIDAQISVNRKMRRARDLCSGRAKAWDLDQAVLISWQALAEAAEYADRNGYDGE